MDIDKAESIDGFGNCIAIHQIKEFIFQIDLQGPVRVRPLN
jgi:hypothetical protein